MDRISPWAILVAALASFAASSAYYIVFANQRAKLSSAAADSKRPQPSKMLAEMVRNVVLALVIAYLVGQLRIADLAGAVRIAILLWVGFPLILLTGSVLWENVPARLAGIHAGDWLVKLILIGAIVTAWHR